MGLFDQYLATPGLVWLTIAVLLAIAELIAPGIFLIFVAIGCAVTGAVLLVAPGLPFLFQVFLFAAATASAVGIGYRWYKRDPVPTSDPLLNDRAARLIGEVVTVVEAIQSGRGRVKVGDGEWNAAGPDTPAGARVRITGAQGTLLDVEPVIS
jgi:membrane protein implicated in regulation of membrane protease activity